MRINQTFVPPVDYKPLKKMKKIYIGESIASSQFMLNDPQVLIGKIIGARG